MELASHRTVAGTPDCEDHDESGAAVVTAICSEVAEKTARYRRGHERAFYTALKAIREIKGAGEPRMEVALPHFADEAACEAYLLEFQAKRPCKCGCRQRTYLAARCRFECRQCGRQAGVRDGTAFGRSQLKLRVWFTATITLLAHPTVQLRDLAAETGVKRLDTLRQIRAKVLQAMDDPRADQLLAGLPALVHQASIACARRATKTKSNGTTSPRRSRRGDQKDRR